MKSPKKRIRSKTLGSRLTGLSISTPIFGAGVSWTAPKPERDIVRNVVNYLEDKRVLYINDEREIRDYVNRSLLEIRKVLMDAISELNQAMANKREADSYAKALILIELRHMPVEKIADELTRRKVQTPRGGRWTAGRQQGYSIDCTCDDRRPHWPDLRREKFSAGLQATL